MNQFNEELSQQTDLIKGCLYGSLLGDTIGLAIVEESKCETQKREDNYNIAYNMHMPQRSSFIQGQLSQKGELILKLSTGLMNVIEVTKFDLNLLSLQIFDWLIKQPFNMNNILQVLHEVVNKIKFEQDYQYQIISSMNEISEKKNMQDNSDFCLCLISPLAIFLHPFPAQTIYYVVKKFVELIQPSDIVIDSCFVYCLLIQYLIQTQGDRIKPFQMTQLAIQAFFLNDDIIKWLQYIKTKNEQIDNINNDHVLVSLSLATQCLLTGLNIRQTYEYLSDTIENQKFLHSVLIITSTLIGCADGFFKLPFTQIESLKKCDPNGIDSQFLRRKQYCPVNIELYLDCLIDEYLQGDALGEICQSIDYLMQEEDPNFMKNLKSSHDQTQFETQCFIINSDQKEERKNQSFEEEFQDYDQEFDGEIQTFQSKSMHNTVNSTSLTDLHQLEKGEIYQVHKQASPRLNSKVQQDLQQVSKHFRSMQENMQIQQQSQSNINGQRNSINLSYYQPSMVKQSKPSNPNQNTAPLIHTNNDVFNQISQIIKKQKF